MTNAHTPEPWKQERDFVDGPRDSEGYLTYKTENGEGAHSVAQCFGPQSDANARRIVACVNACAGIGTDTLEKEASYVRGHRSVIDQRDALANGLRVIEARAAEIVRTYSRDVADWSEDVAGIVSMARSALDKASA